MLAASLAFPGAGAQYLTPDQAAVVVAGGLCLSPCLHYTLIRKHKQPTWLREAKQIISEAWIENSPSRANWPTLLVTGP